MLKRLKKSLTQRKKRRAEEKRIYQKLRSIKAKARRNARREVFGGGTVARGLKSLGKKALKELTKPPPKRKRKRKTEDPFDFW